MIENTDGLGYADMALKDAQRRAASMKKLFDTQFPKVQRKIPEVIFVTYFLQWLAGRVKDTDGSLRQQWLNIAGSFQDPVMIIDKDGKDVRLVPPLNDRSVIGVRMRQTRVAPGTRGDTSVGSMLERAANTATLNANMANAQLQNTLINNFVGNVETQASDELVKAWVELLDHYGVITAVSASGLSEQSDQTPPELEFDFE